MPDAVALPTMSRRIDIELTSALEDNTWTWRAAGAKLPKGTVDGSILSDGAKVGDIVKVEAEQEMDGLTILSVVGGRQKHDRADRLELLPTESEFKPVIETRAKRDRNERRGGGRSRNDRDRGDRGDRRDRDGGRGRDGGRDGGRGRDGGKGRSRDDRGGREGGQRRRSGPSFTPPPEVPQRPKPKRLKAGKGNRNAVLAELPEEQRGIAELALQGMPAVRQRLREENERAAADGRSPMPEATVLKLAEDLLPRLRVAEWRDRAEAAQRQMEHLDLRDLRSVVAAAGDPAVARDESTSALAAELTEALATKQEQELLLWFGDVDAALAVGRVIRALRLSSQPPKAGVPFPADIAQRLVDSTNASLSPVDSPDRWIAMLEAAAFSPIRLSVVPPAKPDVVNDELMATVKRLGPALPKVAELFEVEVDPKAPMPKPLRPGPRKGKGDKPNGGRKNDGPQAKQSGRGKQSGRSEKPGSAEKPGGKNQPTASTEQQPEPTSSDNGADDTSSSSDSSTSTATTASDASTDAAVAAAPAAVAVDDSNVAGVESASAPDAPAPGAQVDQVPEGDAPSTED